MRESRILLVNRDEDAQTAHRSAIESSGWACSSVPTLGDAIDALRSVQPAVVLVDDRTPDIEEENLLSRVRQGSPIGDVPLVLLASRWGVPVSTTHVSCGAIFGIGLAGGKARWGTIAAVLLTWCTTLPLAALMSGALFASSEALLR